MAADPWGVEAIRAETEALQRTSQRLAVEQNELDVSYQLYIEAYDRTLDDRPPLDREQWERMYGRDVLREAAKRGDDGSLASLAERTRLDAKLHAAHLIAVREDIPFQAALARVRPS